MDKSEKQSDTKEENQEQTENEQSAEEQGKESNRLFTQSEFDKALKREKERAKQEIAAKYDDIDLEEFAQVKAQLRNALESKKTENKPNELETAKGQIAELSNKLSEMNELNESFKKSQVKLQIMSDTRYAALPRVYKERIAESTNPNDVMDSADALLAEWQKDLEANAPKIAVGKAIPQAGGAVANPYAPTPDAQAAVLREQMRIKLEAINKPS